MTIPDISTRKRHQGNGSQTAFSFDWEIWAATDIEVIYLDDTLTETTLTYGVDYTIDPGSINNPAGGDIDLTAIVPTIDEYITIINNMAYNQTAAYIEGDEFPAEVHERALDRLCRLTQQLLELQSRTMTLAPSSPDSISAELPAPDPLKGLVWSADGLSLENTTFNLAEMGDYTDRAEAAAVAAEASAVASAGSASASAVSAAESLSWMNFSRQWATEAEDVSINDGVNPTGYSAYHWAQKANIRVSGLYNIENRQLAVTPLESKLTANETFSPVLNNQDYTGTGASRVIDQPVDMGNVIPLEKYTTDTIIIDAEGNHGHSAYMGVRSIEFYLDDVLVSMTTGFTTHETSELNDTYKSENAFNTSLPKTGASADNAWVSLNATTNQRLILKTDTQITFNKIVINNYMNSGADSDIGVQKARIYIKDSTVWTPSTVYGESIPGSIKIFDGIFSEHPATDTVDNQDYAEILWTADQPLPELKSYTAKSFVMDVIDNWGNPNEMAVFKIEFLRNGKVIYLDSTDVTAYATSQLTAPVNAFDLTTGKLGSIGYGWLSATGSPSNQRIICVFNSLQTFDTVRINNGHNDGLDSNRGAKNVVMRITPDTITDTTFGANVSNETEIFNGQLSQHTATDTIDDQDHVQVTSVGGMTWHKNRNSVVNWRLTSSLQKGLSNMKYLTIDTSAAEVDADQVTDLFPLKVATDLSVNAVGDDYLLQCFGTTHKKKTVFSARSVIFDIADSVSASLVGMTCIEFLKDGVVVDTSGGVAYATTDNGVGFEPIRAFDLSYRKSGVGSIGAWLSAAASSTNQRLIYVHPTTFEFDSIRINNGFQDGSSINTGIGANTVIIRTDLTVITNTVYSGTPDADTIFNGSFPTHAAVDTIQDYVITFQKHHYNKELGFGIAIVHGTGYSGVEFAHPVERNVQVAWSKVLTAADSWYFGAPNMVGNNKYLLVDDAQAVVSASAMFQSADDSVIKYGTSAIAAGEKYLLAYWAGDLIDTVDSIPIHGVEGSSAFFVVPSGTGSVIINTRVEDIHTIIARTPDAVSSWETFSKESDFTTVLYLDTSAVEGAAVRAVVTGPIVKITKDATYDRIIQVFGSGTKTGVTGTLTLESSVDDPSILAIADGFNTEIGAKDILVGLTSNISHVNTVADGTWAVKYTDPGGISIITDAWTVYLTEPDTLPSGYSYVIDSGKMYWNDGTSQSVLIIGEVDIFDGEIIDIRPCPNTKEALVKDWHEVTTGAEYVWFNPFNHTEIDIDIYWSLTGSDEDKRKVVPGLYEDSTLYYGTGAGVRISSSEITIGTGSNSVFNSFSMGDEVVSATGYYKIIAKRRF